MDDPDVFPDGCNYRHDRVFQDEAGLRGLGASGSGQGIAEHVALPGLEFLRRVHGFGELSGNAGENSAE